MRARTIVTAAAGGVTGAAAAAGAHQGIWWPAAIWAVMMVGSALRIRWLSSEIRRLDEQESRSPIHRHEPAGWDGLFERCRCGASAGDRRDRNGARAISFDEWPEEERWVRP